MNVFGDPRLGFAAEVFIFIGAFGAGFLFAPLYTAIAMFGIVLVAGYLLFAMQQTLFGKYHVVGDDHETFIPTYDIIPLVIVILIVITLGVAPDIIFGMIQDAVNPIVNLGGGA